VGIGEETEQVGAWGSGFCCVKLLYYAEAGRLAQRVPCCAFRVPAIRLRASPILILSHTIEILGPRLLHLVFSSKEKNLMEH
jgi:hypothetical protein